MLNLRSLRILFLVLLAATLGGCDSVMNPAGDVALRERNLILASTGLMLLIIVPVIVATLLFAWRYRASNTEAAYDPEWHHSTQLEMLIWTAPLLIIVALGALTWISTHVLDPFHTVNRLDARHPITSAVKPLTVEVVALDWKWLFFYPEQGIATVNDLSLPIDRPINFHITSATVMNSFFIPAIAGQIYAMAGMETKLSVVVNRTGDFNGLSSHYSGTGFSHMNFGTHGLAPQAFDAWVASVKGKGTPLDGAGFAQLEKPSEAVAPIYYATFKPKLYDAILNMCATPGKMCQSEMMMIDARGGGGKDSEANYRRLLDDSAGAKQGYEAPAATFPASGRPPNTLKVQPQGAMPRASAPEINERGAPGAAINVRPGEDMSATHGMDHMDGMDQMKDLDGMDHHMDHMGKDTMGKDAMGKDTTRSEDGGHKPVAPAQLNDR